MARPGITYETIQHQCIKLLSQGIAPSVQKLREILGIGSHTTIANHLNRWREEYAKQKVHYLPADMPQELISAFEVLWQTAMRQAGNQLAAMKEEVEQERAQVIQSQQLSDKKIKDLQQSIDELTQKLEQQVKLNQNLNTELKIGQERLEHKEAELSRIQQHYEIKLKENRFVIENLLQDNQQLQQELNQFKEKLLVQAENHQQQLEKQREQQEQSENRWLNLIDQAKLETKEVKKQFEQFRKTSELTLKQLNDKIANMQHRELDQSTQIKLYLDQLNVYKTENNNLMAENHYLKAKTQMLEKQKDIKISKEHRKRKLTT